MAPAASDSAPLRVIHFNPWAAELREADAWLDALAQLDVSTRVPDPANASLVRMARLDADWHGESTRAFAAMTHPALTFRPALVAGPPGLLTLIDKPSPSDEVRWLVFDGQTPEKLVGPLAALAPRLVQNGVRLAWYAFDEVSRTTRAFRDLASHLSILIHDEQPLHPANERLLRVDCLKLHRSWVANVLPFSTPFVEAPEEKILFLGSKLGLTPHRQRQIDFLRDSFGERFVAIHDHSVPVSSRGELNRFKVSVCPEGRKFSTPAMSATHTDRPFWSGCLGLVPVSENSSAGNRLTALAEQRLLLRYAHGDLDALRAACEAGLAMGTEERRRIYDTYNRHETVGAVLADCLGRVMAR